MNPDVVNNTRVLVVCNSYIITSQIRKDIAQSFNESLFIWSEVTADTADWIEEFDPDIVIFESAERFEEFNGIRKLADRINNNYIG